MVTDNPEAREPQAGLPRPAGPSVLAKAHLEVLAGPERGQTFRCNPGATVIGRDEACDVVLSETAVSREHARIERHEGGWVLVNLSSNGTRLNKQEVQEAALADGDEIRVGARTRLRFQIEEVAVSASGRPQFRQRVRRGDRPEVEVEEVRPAEQESGEPEPSLFQRKRKLFIALGAYLGVLLIALIALLAYSGGGPDTALAAVPQLARKTAVRDLETNRYYEVTGSPAGGSIEARDEIGRTRTFTRDDFDSGRAEKITGIEPLIALTTEQIIEKYHIPAYDPVLAKQYEQRAKECYMTRASDESKLYQAVRNFQFALAAAGRIEFSEPELNRLYRSAVAELVNQIDKLYFQALLYEKAKAYGKAREVYKRLLRIVPEIESPLARNFNRRLAALAKMEKQKD